MAEICPHCKEEFESETARNGHIGAAHEGGGNEKISREKLLEELQRLGEELDKRPSCGDMNEQGRYAQTAYINEFGSWNQAIEKLVWQPYEHTARESDNYFYGSHWPDLREDVVKRDGEVCLVCGISRKEHREEYGQDLVVHHIEPRSNSEVPRKADTLENLATVCVGCHQVVEANPEAVDTPS